MICTLRKILFEGDEIRESKMDGTCHTYEEDKVHSGVWWGNLRERDD